MQNLSGLFLAIILLFAQATLLEHEYDFAVHTSGGNCTFCLHATPLGHAIVGIAFPTLPPSIDHTQFLNLDKQKATIPIVANHARAPPVLPFA